MLADAHADEAKGAADGSTAVRRRTTFYIHGFDPRGAAYYHRLFADQSVLQAKVSGASLAVGPRRRLANGMAEWEIKASFEDHATLTRFRLLRWDGAVRKFWPRGEARLLADMPGWVLHFWRIGLLGLTRRAAWPSFAAMLLPPSAAAAFLVLTAVVAAGAGWIAGAILGLAHAPQVIALAAALVAAGSVIALAPRVWRRIDVINIAWLSRCCAFCSQAGRRRFPEIDEIADGFARQILEAASAADVDEVLVVGHSFGAPLAVRALGRALKLDPALGGADPGGATRPTVALLTLGQLITHWNCASGEGDFRSELRAVAKADQVVWLDVTSPSDGASACRLSPLCDISGAAPIEVSPNRPICRSPHFHLIVGPARFKHIRMQPLEYHFQYLAAQEAAGGYDFYRLVAGPERLADFERGWTAFTSDPP